MKSFIVHSMGFSKEKEKQPSKKNFEPTVPRPRTMQPVKTSYTSLPVPIPDSFLALLPDPSSIKVSRIDFAKSPLPEYKEDYAVVLDNVLSQEECDELLLMAEMSAGAHRGEEEEPENNGWKTAMVNAGPDHEVLLPDYRNSDRIIWDDKEVTKRLWKRILQAEGVKEDLLELRGKKYAPVIGRRAVERDECWVATDQGVNERMRFLKYGAGQYFREHCDGSYRTPDGSQESFYTIHLYLNDSAQDLGIPEPAEGDTDPKLVDSKDKPADLIRGGATTFHSPRPSERRLDVDPKTGRVLIFQHQKLYHSGDEVRAGIKYTVRSDIMYQLKDTDPTDGNVVFG